ncbi:MAG: SLBB domain-containing protein [Candidatus Latescibacterota bacterium]|nr:SLBB domain-containing protein [Candidatus Latescibacterota bacterium]
MKVLILWLIWGLTWPADLAGQSNINASGGQERVVDSQMELTQRVPMIGMEAYREVIESGNYLVGGGDEFLIFAPGMQSPVMNRVSAEGGIFIPKVGNVAVAGLRLSQARKAVQERFAEVVRVGVLTFELYQPRSFPVTVVGLVKTPGIYSANGVERVSQVIERAGGLLPEASRRDIRLVKVSNLNPLERERLARFMTLGKVFEGANDGVIKRVDFDMYEVAGQSRFNPFVEDGDVVIINASAGRLGSFGALKRPGFYNLVPGDKVSDLLHLSLGTTNDVDSSNVRLFRYQADNKTRISLDVNMKAIAEGDSVADIELHSNDWLNVGSVPEFQPRSEVFISGEVVFPGYYVISPQGMSLRDIIELAGGFTEYASLSEARIVRRASPDNSGTSRAGVEMIDPEFERIRFVPVSERTEDENQYFIMKSRERVGQMSVDWNRLFKQGDERHNIPLLPGDELHVPRLSEAIIISGAVGQPGSVIYDSTFTAQDYIDRAGGLGWRASKDVRLIKGLSGEVKRVKDGVRIQPGDRIWVKERPERDYWMIFSQAMGIIGQVSTVVLLYASLTGN